MFYVIEITTIEGVNQKGVYEFTSLNDAIASFHSRMGGQMKNPDCEAELVMVIDANGAVYRSEKFNKE